MTHHRLFVALALPPELRASLFAMMGGVSGARWQSDSQLHCTVRFLGELDRLRALDAEVALRALAHPAIDASLGQLGTFGRDGRVATLWVSLDPISAFQALHSKVDRLLGRAGIAPDARAYKPHVTIARFGRQNAPGLDLSTQLTPPPRVVCRLGEVRLYESMLVKDGARYEVVARYPLR